MKILIAGGSGFVGGAVSRRLAGHRLVVPTRDPAKLRASGFSGETPLFGEDLERLTLEARPEVVINLLGILRESPGASYSLVHAEYTRRLLAGARAAGAAKFVQMSALGASPYAPSAYHRSKFAGEEAVRSSGLPYVIFRPSFITGPGQKLREELKELVRYFPVLAAPSDAAAAPIDSGTVAECFAKAAEDPGVRDETFELAGERVVTMKRLLEEELAAAGLKKPVIGLPRRFFYPLLPLLRLFRPPPMTREQYLMMAAPNVPSGKFRGARELLSGGAI